MSYSFNGSNTSLTADFGAQLNDSVNVFMCVYLTHPTALDALFNFGENSASINSSHMGTTGTTQHQYQCIVFNDSGGNGGAASVTQNIDGAWAQLLFRWGGVDFRGIYVDALANSNNNSATSVAVTPRYLSIGDDLAGNQHVTADIAEVAIWDGALIPTASRTALLESGANPWTVDPGSATLRAYWRLNEDRDTEGTIPGYGGLGPTLTITNATYNNALGHPTIDEPGPTITDFGDEAHTWGESGLVITGTNFGS